MPEVRLVKPCTKTERNQYSIKMRCQEEGLIAVLPSGLENPWTISCIFKVLFGGRNAVSGSKNDLGGFAFPPLDNKKSILDSSCDFVGFRPSLIDSLVFSTGSDRFCMNCNSTQSQKENDSLLHIQFRPLKQMNVDQQSNKEICELFITDVLKMECGFNSGNYTKIDCLCFGRIW